MKFIFYFGGRWVPIVTELMSGRVHLELARAAEEVGFFGACLDEHPAPVESWLNGPGGHHCLDPFVALAAVAGATKELRLVTYLAVLPYRNPLMFAKVATTLDVMSDGRAVLGVGTGYMRGEFDALGVEFDHRNALFDEAISVFRQACRNEPLSVVGRSFNARDVVLLPGPIQRPHPPLWIGGNSKLSRRRAATFGQGWCPMPQARARSDHKTPPLETLEDLNRLIDELREMERTAERATPLDIIMSSVITDPSTPFETQLETIKRLEDLGVTHLTVNGEGRSPGEALDFVRRYGDQIVRHFA